MSAITASIDRLSESQRLTLMAKLPVAHQKRNAAILTALEREVFRQWMTTGRYANEAWPSLYAAIVGRGQQTMYAAAAGFSADLATLALGRVVTPTVASSSAPWIKTAASASATAAAKRLGTKMLQGLAFDDASYETGRYLRTVASRDGWEAARGAMTDLDQTDARPSGYRKQLSGKPCAWCVTVSDTLYRADSVPAHNNDHCAVVPSYDSDPARSNQQQEWEGQPLPDQGEGDVENDPATVLFDSTEGASA